MLLMFKDQNLSIEWILKLLNNWLARKDLIILKKQKKKPEFQSLNSRLSKVVKL